VLQKFRGELQMLDSRGQGGDNQVGYSGGSGGGQGRGGGSDFGQSGPGNRSGGEGGGFSRELDDDIPF
jgi:single-strand DNA-binding protein